MASRQRYVKLTVPAVDRLTGKNSVVGCIVIADYQADGQRTIVVERPLTATGHRATRTKTKKVDTKASEQVI